MFGVLMVSACDVKCISMRLMLVAWWLILHFMSHVIIIDLIGDIALLIVFYVSQIWSMTSALNKLYLGQPVDDHFSSGCYLKR